MADTVRDEMHRRLNILFTCVGRRVSLIRHFRRALDELGVTGELLGVDATEMAPAFHVVDKAERVCPIPNEDYIPSLLRLCTKHNVSLLVPLLDTELPKLSQSRKRFEEAGTLCLVSDPEVVEISRDKRRTCEFFLGAGVDTPRILDRANILSADYTYPVFVKPVKGSASIGSRRVMDRQELCSHLRRYPDCIVMENLEGEEYTLDVLTDFEGRVRCVVPRLRIETRAGEVSKSMTVKNRVMMQAGKMVVEKLSPDDIAVNEIAGEKILARLTRAPANNAPIGGLKVVTENGWFALRPSGTEDVLKVYTESFRDRAHLEKIQAEARHLIEEACRKAGA